MVYKFKEGSHISGVNPQAAGEFMESLRKDNQGRLTPALLVDRSKSARSPTHKAFDWNDAIAGKKWRLSQAQHLIACTVTMVDRKGKPPEEVRAFVNVHQDGDEERSYTSVEHALSDAELKRQVLGQAINEARAWQQRYSVYAELADVFAAIHRAESRFEKKGEAA